MSTPFPLFPPSASTVALEMDLLYLFIVAVNVFFVVLVAALVVFFAIKYRRRHPAEVGIDIHGSIALELTWTFIPFVLALIMFVWGADLFFRLARPPQDAMEIFVVGKQWMWKIQHPEGVREINELHIPINRPIKISLGSEDVLHDFFIPAFRVKMDAVPGKLTTLWFEATKPGRYFQFCAEYCGTKHSGMIGEVIAMTPQDYEAWLAGGRSTGSAVQNGERLFTDLSCITCHKADSTGRGPSLHGVFGSTVPLADGRKVVADENYLRESIVNSQAKVVQGFQPVMPAFQGQISEENLMQLIAYIKSLKKPEPAAGAPKSEHKQ
jgi:cytochrome c oxidase subunit II